MAKIQDLKDKLGGTIYPKSLTRAVYDGHSGESLDVTLQAMQLEIDSKGLGGGSTGSVNVFNIISILDFEHLIPNKELSADLWDWSASLQAAIDSAVVGETVYIPNGSYKMYSTITIKNMVGITGEHKMNTRLLFQGVSGFTTPSDVKNYYSHIQNMRIIDELRGLDTIGISYLAYASYQKVTNVKIEQFGKWGLYQEGGLQFQFEEISTKSNGNNCSSPLDGGSIFINEVVQGSIVSTTGFLRNVYLKSGGHYGLKMYRNVGTTCINVTIESHNIALYADKVGKATMYNFYEESNKAGLDTVWLHDSQVVFITPHFHGKNPVKRTWSGTSHDSRQTMFIDNKDMEARFVSLNQVNLLPSSQRTEDKEGGLKSYNGKLMFRDKTSWKNVALEDESSGNSIDVDFVENIPIKLDLGKPSNKNLEVTVSSMISGGLVQHCKMLFGLRNGAVAPHILESIGEGLTVGLEVVGGASGNVIITATSTFTESARITINTIKGAETPFSIQA